MVKFVLIEPCNFKNYPIGGQLSFAKQLMSVFGNDIALVGYASEGDPIGQWFKKDIEGLSYHYFAICNLDVKKKKPLIPLRIQNLFWFSIYAKKIMQFENKNWFIQAPEVLISASRYNKESICYMFPGVENPLEKPRYRWGKLFAKLFNQLFILSVNKANVLLACADQNTIFNMIERNKNILTNTNIKHFPTRYDSDIFFPIDICEARNILNLPTSQKIIITSGRINKGKGWPLILNAFSEYQKVDKNSLLIFVGDGENRLLLEERIINLGLSDHVLVTGFKSAEDVAFFLNSSDLYVVGSENEGWSIAMLEALACGKPIVSTNISGATTLIAEGENGYILEDRDEIQFAAKIKAALSLEATSKKSISVANQYKLNSLKNDIMAAWKRLD